MKTNKVSFLKDATENVCTYNGYLCNHRQIALRYLPSKHSFN